MSDFIDDFQQLLTHNPAPEHYKWWGGAALVSATLARDVWTRTVGHLRLYPNQYILLVGGPGTGKTLVVEQVRNILQTVKKVQLIPDSTTYERLIQQIAARGILSEGPDEEMIKTCAVTGALSEFGSILRKADLDFMTILAQLWDCQPFFERDTISRELDQIENSCFNLLAGVQPAWFTEGFPTDAFERGLPARLILIYSDEDELPEFFEKCDEIDYKPFTARLNEMSEVEGYIPFTQSAKEAFKRLADNNFEPVPTDTLLESYSRRRHMHLGKLSLIMAMSSHPRSLKIVGSDVERAFEAMLEAEKDMPKSLAAAGGNIYRMRSDAIARFVAYEYSRTRKAVAEWKIRDRLGRLCPPNMVSILVDEMIAARTVKTIGKGKSPNRLLIPGES